MTRPTDPDRLKVWHTGSLVGELWRDRQDRIGFSYGADWLAQGFGISRVLPLRPEPFGPEEGLGHAWFSNLLPEGAARERIVRNLGVADDDFVLLREIGGDCAGALSVLPIDQAVDEQTGAEQLDEAGFQQMLQQRGQGILPGLKHDQAARPRPSSTFYPRPAPIWSKPTARCRCASSRRPSSALNSDWLAIAFLERTSSHSLTAVKQDLSARTEAPRFTGRRTALLHLGLTTA